MNLPQKLAIPNFFPLKFFVAKLSVNITFAGPALVGLPAHFLPVHVRDLPAEEQALRLQFWGSAMLLETAVVCVLGTLVMCLKGREVEKKTSQKAGRLEDKAAAEGELKITEGDIVKGEQRGEEEELMVLNPEDPSEEAAEDPGQEPASARGYQERCFERDDERSSFFMEKKCDTLEKRVAEGGSAAWYLFWRLRSRPDDPETDLEACRWQAQKGGRVHYLLWRLKNEKMLQMQVATGVTFLLHFALSTGMVLWCSLAGLLSKKTGLPSLTLGMDSREESPKWCNEGSLPGIVPPKGLAWLNTRSLD